MEDGRSLGRELERLAHPPWNQAELDVDRAHVSLKVMPRQTFIKRFLSRYSGVL